MSDGTIVLEALRKEYFELVAVRDLNWTIPAGEIYGLIGPNGAGKTTTLRMMATTLEPTSGRVRFAGSDVWRDPTAWRRRMGFMPDFFQMYEGLKVRELLTYFGMAHGLKGAELRRRVRDVIEQTDLTDKAEQLARGLSRGMVQRLGLARAIVHKPDVLLLDEPASGLDPLARRDLLDLLKRVHAEGTTIVISSHILSELSGLVTAVAIMHEGAFLETGRTDQILRKILPQRQIVAHVAGSPEAAVHLLGAHPKVADLKADGARLRFLFDGSDEDLAELNAALVRAGVRVARLEEAQPTLDELYYAIAERKDHAPAG